MVKAKLAEKLIWYSNLQFALGKKDAFGRFSFVFTCVIHFLSV